MTSSQQTQRTPDATRPRINKPHYTEIHTSWRSSNLSCSTADTFTSAAAARPSNSRRAAASTSSSPLAASSRARQRASASVSFFSEASRRDDVDESFSIALSLSCQCGWFDSIGLQMLNGCQTGAECSDTQIICRNLACTKGGSVGAHRSGGGGGNGN